MNVCYRCRYIYLPEETYKSPRCLHPDVERTETVSPITGDTVYLCSEGGRSSQRHPDCSELNNEGTCPYYEAADGTATRDKAGEEIVVKYGE